MEGEDMNICIYLIWRIIYRMHDKWMVKPGKMTHFCLPAWISHFLPVLKCWDSYINHTVPGSLIRPYSPLYQSNDAVFLTEESERSPDWSKDRDCLLLYLKSWSTEGFLILNPLLCFFSCNTALCITVLFSWKINPGHVWYGHNLSSGAAKHAISLPYCASWCCSSHHCLHLQS